MFRCEPEVAGVQLFRFFVLAICALVSLIAICAFAWLAAQNSASDKILKPAIQITAALIAAVAFFSMELLTSDDESKSETKYLAIYHKSGGLYPYSDPLGSIDSEYGRGFKELREITRKHRPDLGANDEPLENIQTIALQDLEAAFLKWLAERNYTHWDIDDTFFQGIGTGGGAYRPKNDAEKQTTRLALGDLSAEISSRFDSSDIPTAHFPLGTTIKRERRMHSTKIALESKEYVLVFELGISGGGILGATRLTQQLSNSIYNTKDWRTVRGVVKIKATYKRLRKWSKRTSRISVWVSDMSDEFERDFGWDGIRPDLEDALSTLRWKQKYVTPYIVTNAPK